jgi:hypothetical protein
MSVAGLVGVMMDVNIGSDVWCCECNSCEIGEGKFVPVHAMKAYGGVGVTSRILNPVAKWR